MQTQIIASASARNTSGREAQSSNENNSVSRIPTHTITNEDSEKRDDEEIEKSNNEESDKSDMEESDKCDVEKKENEENELCRYCLWQGGG